MKKINVLLVLVVVVFVATFAGCKKTSAVEDKPVASETVSSEEVSEEVSEEPSEEVPEIVDGVQMVYYQSYNELCSYFDTIEGTVFCEYYFLYPESGQAILYDGAHYELRNDYILTIKSSKNIANVTSTLDYVFVMNYEYNGIIEWDVYVETTGTDIEVPVTITYDDGTEENITIYVTKEWKNSLEE